jgi:membrane dipeptidase
MRTFASIFIMPFIFFGMNSSGQNTPSDLDKKIEKIHQKILTVDSHNDTPMHLMEAGFDLSKRHDPVKDHSKVDFPRMREGGEDASFFAVFVSQGKRTPEGNFKAKERADALFDSIYAVLARFSGEAGLAVSPSDAYKLKKQGKRAIFIGMENGYPIGNDLSLIQTFYTKGARYITLCHTRNNDICDSSTDSTEYNGLSEFGKSVVKFMNKTGMMVDVSHISDKSFYDVIALSKAPVIASHSCARALCDNPRNMDDDMLRALAKNGGVIQMCILSAYVKKQDSNLATVSDVVDHIDHIVKVAGIDHVGIGTDFDGGGGVTGCFDVSQMKNITRELLQRSYTTRDIRKIWGGNLMRVMRKVRKIARKLNPACNC